MVVKLTFLGAAQNVTGSRHLLEAGGTRILVDCGLYQERELQSRNWERFPEPPWRLPEEWEGARPLQAVALTVSGEGEPTEVAAADGMVTFNLAVGVPFRVTP